VSGLQLSFHGLGTIRRIGPDITSRLSGEEDVLKDLTVMNGGIRHGIPPTELVGVIHVHMIVVPLVIHPMLHGPSRLRVFLPPFGWLRLPLCRALAGFDTGVVRARVALFRHGHQRGINQLPPTRCKPCAARYASNCSNKVATACARVRGSRNSQMVLASGMR